MSTTYYVIDDELIDVIKETIEAFEDNHPNLTYRFVLRQIATVRKRSSNAALQRALRSLMEPDAE